MAQFFNTICWKLVGVRKFYEIFWYSIWMGMVNKNLQMDSVLNWYEKFNKLFSFILISRHKHFVSTEGKGKGLQDNHWCWDKNLCLWEFECFSGILIKKVGAYDDYLLLQIVQVAKMALVCFDFVEPVCLFSYTCIYTSFKNKVSIFTL